MNRKSLIPIAAGLIIGAGIGLLGLAFLGDGKASPAGPSSVGAGVERDAPAPDFTLQALNGEPVQLSELHGKVVLINFWATWCAPCRIEMPALQSRFEKYSPDLVVLAVDFDEPADAVEAFADELGLTFPVLLDPGGQVNREVYQVRGYPSSFFVDRAGVLRIIHIGIMTEGQLDGYLGDLGLSG